VLRPEARLAAHYFSWRVIQFSLGVIDLLIFLFVLFVFPEPCHPGERGVDKVDRSSLPTWRPILINHSKSLWLLRRPALLAVVGLAANFIALILTHIFSFQQTLAGFRTMITEYGMLQFANFFE